VRRPLAQEEQEGRFGEPLDAGEDVPAAVMVPAGARAASSHERSICKRHM
jgi:hypothetical protein